MSNCLVFGAGGHAGVILDAIQESNLFTVEAVVTTDVAECKNSFEGIPVLEQSPQLLVKTGQGIVAIGDNFIRSNVVAEILKINPDFKFISVIHSSATISHSVKIGLGVFIAAGVTINPNAIISDHSIINTSSTIEHENHIHEFASIGPGSTLGGNVSIGKYTAIGLGSCLNHNITIGEHTVVGTNSTVLSNLAPNILAVGTPCREIRKRERGEPYL